MEPHVTQVPVLVVGAGPVGLALALELGLRGIDCIVIDERDGKVNLPKMNTVSTRTMEFCRRWGVASKIKQAGVGENYPLDVRFITSMAGYELLRLPYPSYRERGQLDYSPEGMCVCSQLWFDPILLERVRTLSKVSLRLFTRIDEFEQSDGVVRAKVMNLQSGLKETIVASYLVGCDGAESSVRDMAGIELLGDPRLNTNLNIFFHCPAFVSLQNGRLAQMHRIVGAEGLWGNMHALDGRGLWRMTVQLRDDAAPDINSIIRRVAGCDVDFEVRAVFKWDRRKMVAARYRNGRVFLAGDAAHQMSTTGGFGMNTGIGDAVDLAWKLEATLNGWGGRFLLDSYEVERKPIAMRNLEEATEMFLQSKAMHPGSAIGEDSPEGERLRAAFSGALLEGNIRRQFEVEGIALGYRYDSSFMVCSDGTPPPRDEVSTYAQTARPGSRAPHAWQSAGHSTLDLFGDGFKLLRFGRQAVDVRDILVAAAARQMPLAVIDIEAPEIAKLYERKLVLVRPDGHVAWRADSPPTDSHDLVDRVRGMQE